MGPELLSKYRVDGGDTECIRGKWAIVCFVLLYTLGVVYMRGV